jgi:hypothetical protein
MCRDIYEEHSLFLNPGLQCRVYNFCLCSSFLLRLQKHLVQSADVQDEMQLSSKWAPLSAVETPLTPENALIERANVSSCMIPYNHTTNSPIQFKGV